MTGIGSPPTTTTTTASTSSQLGANRLGPFSAAIKCLIDPAVKLAKAFTGLLTPSSGNRERQGGINLNNLRPAEVKSGNLPLPNAYLTSGVNVHHLVSEFMLEKSPSQISLTSSQDEAITPSPDAVVRAKAEGAISSTPSENERERSPTQSSLTSAEERAIFPSNSAVRQARLEGRIPASP